MAKESMYLIKFDKNEYEQRIFDLEQALKQLNTSLNHAFDQELGGIIPDIPTLIFQVQSHKNRNQRDHTNMVYLKEVIYKKLEAKYIAHGIELANDQFYKHWERYKVTYNSIGSGCLLSEVKDKNLIKYDEESKCFVLPNEAKEHIKEGCSIYTPYNERLKLLLKTMENLNKIASTEGVKLYELIGKVFDCSDGLSINVSRYMNR